MRPFMPPLQTTASTPALDALAARLTAYRVATGTEAAFQADIARVLEREGLAFEREYPLSGGRGRIDFYLRGAQIGLELKVQGQSPSLVAAQLQRYAGAPEIAGLILVTARRALGRLPPVIGGKPLRVAACWRGGL